jgi:hypothetical protein
MSSKKLLLTVQICFIIAAVTACTFHSEKSSLVAVNFFNQPVDLRIGEEPQPVFFVKALLPREVSPLARTGANGDFPVSYKISGSTVWQRMPKELGSALCTISPEAIVLIAVDSRGVVRLTELNDDARPGGRICFVNAANMTVKSVSVVKNDDEPAGVFWARDIKSFSASGFFSVLPGEYGIAVELLTTFRGSTGAPDRATPAALTLRCEESVYSILFYSWDKGAPVVKQKNIALRDQEHGLVPCDR